MPTQANVAAYTLPRNYLNGRVSAARVELLDLQTVSIFSQGAFDALISAYRGSGGTARAEDLALLLAEKGQGSFSSLARGIVKGEIFSIEWNSHFWLPMFQFEAHDMSMKHSVRKIMSELAHVLDNWSLATWFAEPNVWLRNCRPVDMLDSNLPEVFAAARAERFVAAG